MIGYESSEVDSAYRVIIDESVNRPMGAPAEQMIEPYTRKEKNGVILT